MATSTWRGPDRFELAALLPLIALTAVWCWWGAKSGAYFGTVLLPGTVALCATLAVIAWIGALARQAARLAGR